MRIQDAIAPLLGTMAIALTASAPAAAQTAVAVAVDYWKRPCGMPGLLAERAGVTAGTLEIQRGGGTPVTVMLGANPVAVTVPGTGFLSAKLTLETPRVKVVSGAATSTPITIDLGPSNARGLVETFSVHDRDSNHNGNVQALITLDRGAEIAERANGSRLPPLTARVFDGPGVVAGPTHFDSPATINVVAVAGSDDRWEPTPLLHEYGHFLLEHVAPGGPAGDAHSIATSYPEKPDLAWTEGFPSAFAAVVTRPEWHGSLQYQCGPYQLLDRLPPLATPRDERYAQYNESRVAAVAYRLTEHRGGGVAGLQDLLDAMRRYERDGHGVWTARDLRDMAVESFERSAADHAAIDRIFASQHITWEQSFGLELLGNEDTGRWADMEIKLSVTGPGGFDCHATADIYGPKTTPLDASGDEAHGVLAARGGLHYSANDDCYLISGDGVVGVKRAQERTDVLEEMDLPFPYLAGRAHWQGTYTLTAKYVCARVVGRGSTPGFRCPETFTVQLFFKNPWLVNSEPKFVRPIPVRLVRNVDMPLVTFKATGECTAIGGVDCGF